MSELNLCSCQPALYCGTHQFRELQTCPNLHLSDPDAPKDQNRHVQIFTPRPSSASAKQEQTYPNSHPLVEDTPAEDLPAAGPLRGVQIRAGLELWTIGSQILFDPMLANLRIKLAMYAMYVNK